MRLIENSTSRKIFNSLNEDFWNPCKYAEMIMNLDIDPKKWNAAETQEERDAMVRPQLEEFWKEYGRDIKEKRLLRRIYADLEDSNFHTEGRILRDIVSKSRMNESSLLENQYKVETMSFNDYRQLFAENPNRLLLCVKYFKQYAGGVTGANRTSNIYVADYDWTKSDIRDFIKAKGIKKYSKEGKPSPYGDVGAESSTFEIIKCSEFEQYEEECNTFRYSIYCYLVQNRDTTDLEGKDNINESLYKDGQDFEELVKRDFRLFLMDKYGDELYKDVNNDDINEYFTGMFYDIEDNDDLDAANEAERIIRNEYNCLDSRDFDDYDEYDDGDTNWAAEEASDTDERFENRYMNGGNGSTFESEKQKRYAVNIDWETDGNEKAKKELPTKVEIPDDVDENNVADWLSDKYGWLVNSVSIDKSLNEDAKIWSNHGQEEYYQNMTREEMIQEIKNNGWDEEEINGKPILDSDDDELREYLTPYDINLDYEDYEQSILPMIKKQCYGDYIVLCGTAANWRGKGEACKAIKVDDLKDYFFPDYDASIQLYCDNNDDLYYTEANHDTPVGGTEMYLYSFWDETDYDNAEKALQKIYEDEDFDMYYFCDYLGYSDAEQLIKSGLLKPVKRDTHYVGINESTKTQDFIIEKLDEAKKHKKEDKRVIMQQGNVTCIKENSSYLVFENESDNEVEHDSEESAMQDFLERVGVNPECRDLEDKTSKGKITEKLDEANETEERIIGTYEVYKDGQKCNIEVKQFNNGKSKMYAVDNPFKGFEWGTNFYKTEDAVKKFLSKHNATKKN